MIKCAWERLSGLRTPEEFQKIERWMAEQIELGYAFEIPVKAGREGPYPSQRWFAHQSSGEVWRLAGPRPEFPGSFEAVTAPGDERKILVMKRFEAVLSVHNRDLPEGVGSRVSVSLRSENRDDAKQKLEREYGTGSIVILIDIEAREAANRER